MKKREVLRNKKGFTLIEIIVVLIILAVLAAFAIPSMLGFVEQSRGKAYITEARVGFMAAQAVVTEVVGNEGKVDETTITTNTKIMIKTATGLSAAALVTEHPTFTTMVKEVLDTGHTKGSDKFTNVIVDKNSNNVIGIEYHSDGVASTNTGYIIKIHSGGTDVTKKPITP